MPEWLQNLIRQFGALAPARQATLVVTGLGSLAFFGWVASGAQSVDHRLLYRGLEDAEIAQVADALAAERIEYELGEGGTAILVPASRVHEARMRIASRGLPSGSTPGFEIFDQGSFGVTDFVQKVNYHRALQGELARTIEQVEGVEKARVQLAIPERRSLVRRDARKPTASVVTRLRAGWDLESGQVRGIVHLVASSVEGLDVAQVTLVDHRGRLLAPQADMEGVGAGSPALGAERRLEQELEDQIESILERTVGLGRVVAKVSAKLDWTQTERTEETFDPDSQVARSTQLDSETLRDGEGEGGVAGIVANSPDVVAGSTEEGGVARSTRNSETINYEISKTVSRSVLPTGQLERLSIAVLVDGKPAGTGAPEAAEGENTDGESPAFVPWSAEELLEFEQLAKRAVGFDLERGDEISVINSPFLEIDADSAPAGFMTPDLVVLVDSLLRGVALLLALFFFSRFFVRPLADAIGGGDTAAIESLRDELTERLSAVEVERSGGDALPALGGGDRAPNADADIPGLVEQSDEMTLQQQVDRLAQLRAEDSVRTIRGWMATGG